MLVQADGRILTAGSGVAGGVSVDFTVARYRADGSLDPTFSNDGRIVAGGRSCKFPRDLG